MSLKNAGYGVKIVALYKAGLKEKEIVAGIEVERIKLRTRSWPKHPAIKLIKYFEFLLKSLCRYRKADIYHCNDLDPLPAVFLLKVFNRKAKIVYDAHELETEMNGMKEMEKKIRRLIEKILIKRVNAIITVSKLIAESYARIYHIEEPALVLNAPKYTDCVKNGRFRKEFDIPDDKIILLYHGGFGPGRGIKNIIKSIKFIKSNVCIVFMGGGTLVDYIRNKTKEYPGKIYYKPTVLPFEVLHYAASADIGLCLLENTCLSYYYSLPNKLFEYLMAGLPVIISDFPEMERIAKKEYNCGLATDPTQPNEIASKIDELINNKKLFEEFKTNAELAVKKYNWENQEKVLKKIYEKL